MRETDIASAEELTAYLDRLERALAALPADERRDILLETRSHVLDRVESDPARAVSSVLGDLGEPEHYAERFGGPGPADERPARSRGVVAGLLRLARGGVLSFAAFSTIVIVYGLSLIFFLIALWKVRHPAQVGLWIEQTGRGPMATFTISAGVAPPPGREVLGWWVVPLALALALAVYGLATLALRGVLRLLDRRPRRAAVGRSGRRSHTAD